MRAGEAVHREEGRLGATLFRFLLVGGTAAAAYALICTMLTRVLAGHAAAISIAVHMALIPIAYYAQRRITFRGDGQPIAEFLKYALLQIVSISIATSLLSHLTSDDWRWNLAVFLAISAMSALVSFVICDTLVFKSRADRRP